MIFESKVSDQPLPAFVEVEGHGVTPSDWLAMNAQRVKQLIQEKGAVLIRGLNIGSSRQFSRIFNALTENELLNYSYRSTPRTSLNGNVYTSTEFPAEQFIAQHNENSYSNQWPMYIGFFCLVSSQEGGRTPICNSHLVYKTLPETLKHKFEAHGIKYVRNYTQIDLPWQEVFQTESKETVEALCKEWDIDTNWHDDCYLRTVQQCQASISHPQTKEKIWFNQAHLFHHSNLTKDVQAQLLANYGEQHLPRNAYFGNGEQIDEMDLEVIRQTYNELTIEFDWQKNDLLLLDNMRFSHGRTPFKGERKVLVAMSKLFQTNNK